MFFRAQQTRDAYHRIFDTLKKRGLVERAGAAKGGRWLVKKPE
jgi:DNA-binding IscR family transcriptional regulator